MLNLSSNRLFLLIVTLFSCGNYCSAYGLVFSNKPKYLRMSSIVPDTNFKELLQTNSDLYKQIFCNVELNCENLEAIGFDMDFTLAQYNEAFDRLCFECFKEKLVKVLGYPRDILDFKYRSNSFRRGLVIDKKRGNILKVDRHRYVRIAYHGSQPLKERRAIYARDVNTFTESNYVNIDTISLLIEALLFTYLVDYKNQHPEDNLFASKSYEKLYHDVQLAVEFCNGDGVIRDAVIKSPEKYIIYDENLVPMLQQMRAGGKKLFLLTNSLWNYTDVVMNYLISSKLYKGVQWQDLFEVIIVGASKPAFLSQEYLSIFKVDNTGKLHNVEDKDCLTVSSLAQHKRFHGGNWLDLHRMLNVSFGDRILYVGDHMYSDILRSKRTLGWRTCLIIPELEKEIAIAQREAEHGKLVMSMRQLQHDWDEYIDALRAKQRAGENVSAELSQRENEAAELKKELRKATDYYNKRFNKFWGQLFKAGHQESRFSKQVMEYACLYTSRVTNLGLVSPNRPFRPVHDFLPADQIFEAEFHSATENF